MKVGEGGEAFFVFETRERIPQDLQTSPLVSPETSPLTRPTDLGEPDLLDLADGGLEQGLLGASIERPKSVDGIVLSAVFENRANSACRDYGYTRRSSQ
jgi:phosphatidate phosphatase PAH1